MAIYVVPDIHGEYNKLLNVIRRINKVREPNETIVFLGDYIDRGDNSKDVVNYIFALMSNDDNIVALLGNHDYEFYNIMERVERLNIYDIEWLSRYCIETLSSYGVSTLPLKYNSVEDNMRDNFDFIKEELIKLKKSDNYRKFKILMANCRKYYKEGKYIFTHSGGVSYKPVEEQSLGELLWSRDFKPRNDDYIYVCGHTPTSSREVEENGSMLMCDVGAVFGVSELPLIRLEE
ncbi:NinI-like serine-threonine phosphatase [Staphylococcus phage vB_SscM-1]|uniref:Serine/threonine protein phosphatase n=2 Tax=Sciuriunavirus SscM1 TaxID=2734053 RepID=A0A1X9I9D7_9CAUD|nr:NinI-like serine-threonine phosphatase [Staphylococcus phage vB_SscM-1]ANT44710.1 serine/threonine protein phosphatase [Staphylococcus phage vB_SscM-1]ANT44913.1 serine/threonine protein phosphatase I [Staphylococcus phage vB_SscM-2]